MTKEEILSNNKLIAEFMGYDSEMRVGGRRWLLNGYWTLPERMHYHTSWDWLMPVVEKIEGMGYGVTIDGQICEIYKNGRDYSVKTSDTKLSATYQAVCEFIKQVKG